MFRFCNRYHRRLWVAFQWYSPDCEDGSDWSTKGWWRIEPGGCAVVFGPDLRDVNSYYYYYAEADDAAFWAGPFDTHVPNRRFDWCLNTSSTDARVVGFREIYTDGYSNYTINLVA